MKVEIITDTEKEEYVAIHCHDITDEVKKLESHIKNFSSCITATDEREIHNVSLDEIFYIESVDKKTFIYTREKVLMTDKRLYELEEILDGKEFFRCSKSVIINLKKIDKLKPEITRNILATLSNGEVVVVSRRYAAELKKLLGI
ncbi:MAG: LytTR family transcriptional regulator [Lachnospiraceae bacterium]|nr:LytTR family transcriptional regulator [Lachnospiraceae bacterium]